MAIKLPQDAKTRIATMLKVVRGETATVTVDGKTYQLVPRTTVQSSPAQPSTRQNPPKP